MQSQKLSSLRKGERADIVSIDSAEMEMMLMRLGVIKGDRFRLSDVAPLGDPIAIEINRTKVSMRRKDAELIWVRKYA